jgi:hypothetical protein
VESVDENVNYLSAPQSAAFFPKIVPEHTTLAARARRHRSLTAISQQIQPYLDKDPLKRDIRFVRKRTRPPKVRSHHPKTRAFLVAWGRHKNPDPSLSRQGFVFKTKRSTQRDVRRWEALDSLREGRMYICRGKLNLEWRPCKIRP